MSTVQQIVRGYDVSTMAVPWAEQRPTIRSTRSYEWYVERAVTALAERYAKKDNLAFVNVCGPSASGGRNLCISDEVCHYPVDTSDVLPRKELLQLILTIKRSFEQML